MAPEAPASGHVFLSYVREDTDAVDRLQADLEAAGLRVWRDTEDLWPGDDWSMKIREAIQGDALVFLACFSTASAARNRTYQNEELVVAIEAFRQRRPDEPWLIPVRLDDCAITDREIGAGRMLSSLQRVDLFGEGSRRGMSRLVATILRLLGRTTSSDLPLATSLVDQLKAMLPLPERDIALEELVMAEVDRCVGQLSDVSRFPTSLPTIAHDTDRIVLDQARQYFAVTQPLTELVVTGCAYGGQRHLRLWRAVIEAVGATIHAAPTGHAVLLDLRRLALLPLLFGASISATAREKWPALVAVTTQARLRNRHRERISAIGDAHVWLPFASVEALASAFAIETTDGKALEPDYIEGLYRKTRSRRLTPVSDALHDHLRPLLRPIIRNDDDYDDAFDEAEVLLALLAGFDAQAASRRERYQHGAWYGSFTWRRRYDADFERRVWADRRLLLEGAGAYQLPADDVEAVAKEYFERSARARFNR